MNADRNSNRFGDVVYFVVKLFQGGSGALSGPPGRRGAPAAAEKGMDMSIYMEVGFLLSYRVLPLPASCFVFFEGIPQISAHNSCGASATIKAP